MTDGNIEPYWAVEDDNLTPTAIITLPKPATFDVIRLREQTRLGQRVDSFNIDAFINQFQGLGALGSRENQNLAAEAFRVETHGIAGHNGAAVFTGKHGSDHQGIFPPPEGV